MDSFQTKPKVLIVDDSSMNRMMLTELLSDEYTIIEAKNGQEAIIAISHNPDDIDLVILDLVMPVMDGFTTLKTMKERGWLATLPVIVVSAEDGNVSMEKVYSMGATDFFPRPYNSAIIHNRIRNTLALYKKQKHLVGVVEEQVTATEEYSRQMIDILGNIVEFRNGESNLHIHNVQLITRILLEQIAELTDKYKLTNQMIMHISVASALHDIGKIAINEDILNKPGKLTSEEFEQIKMHSAIGSQMIQSMPGFKENANNENGIYKYAYEICRWHHERWNGLGYPDGLRGDSTPISAQAVAMADVYDALTSARCYKPSFSHDTALNMILSGECGEFNPLLYDCLRKTEQTIYNELHSDKSKLYSPGSMAFKVTNELIVNELEPQDFNKKYLLSFENAKRRFFSKGIKEIQVEYDTDFGMVTFSDYGVDFLKLNSSSIDVKTLRELTVPNGNFNKLMELVDKTTPREPIAQGNLHLENDGKSFFCEVKIMTLWDGDDVLNRKSIMMRIIPFNTFEAMDIIDETNYDDKSFATFYNEMKKVFDIVRVVDPIDMSIINGKAYDKDISNNHKNCGISCYSIWGKKERCQNCISYMALKTKKTQSKIEFLNDKAYQVFSKYMEIKGEPRIVEMVYQNRDDLILDTYGKSNFTDYVNSYNRRLYRDPLTNAYNRRYYEEVGKYTKNITCVAMVDVDNFKAINDKYGHLTGDKAIRAVAKKLKECVGEENKVIRYGGDEFILLFSKTDGSTFENKLKNIVATIEHTRVEGEPKYTLSITAGGVTDITSIEQALTDADSLMYKGKLGGSHIVIKHT